MSILEYLIIIFLFITVVGVVNERYIKLQSDIALVLFTSIICLVLHIAASILNISWLTDALQKAGSFKFEAYLIDTALCFMLFAGAGKVNMGKFKENIKTISLLALLTTVISSTLFGALFYGVACLFHLPVSIWICILLGCIVSPTDPIAATGILNKLGLSKNVTSVIESESLFNDGTGVALFVFIRSIVTCAGSENFVIVMLKEIFGAVFVAFAVSFLLFHLLKLSRNPVMHIMISLFDVALSYAICERFGFSGVIASVVCGMYFSYKMEGIARKRNVDDEENRYEDFWECLEEILNAVFFALIGISLLDVSMSRVIYIIAPATILIVIVSRFFGVLLSSLLAGRKDIPGGYSLTEFVALMTWTALKGGLSLALAMSTRSFLEEDVYLLVLNAAYITIFFTVIVQGLSTKAVYQKLEKHKAVRIRRQSERQ